MDWMNILPTLGGILLILGSYSLYRGKALISILFYFVADLCWLGMAIHESKIFGAISVTIGILFSLGVFYKMNKGIFYKDLRIKK
jgi:uncharacterized membrane protein